MSDSRGTDLSLVWLAREVARLYVGFDAFGRMPQPTCVFRDGGKHAEIRNRAFLPAPPFTVYLPDAVVADSDVEDFRKAVLEPIVIEAMKRKGVWRSQFRNRLLAQWRVEPLKPLKDG